jgi:hypothetical protein
MACMSGPLRHIALTVEQTGNRSYAWLLIESAAGRVFVLKRAQRESTSYTAALAQGYEELVMLSACGLHERALARDDAQSRPQPQALELRELQDAL